jgi:hypothetical protein
MARILMVSAEKANRFQRLLLRMVKQEALNLVIFRRCLGLTCHAGRRGRSLSLGVRYRIHVRSRSAAGSRALTQQAETPVAPSGS